VPVLRSLRRRPDFNIVVKILVSGWIEQSAKSGKAPTSIPSRVVNNPRDNKTIRLVVIVVLALIVAYLLYSAS
jgi:hypothetical protein